MSTARYDSKLGLCVTRANPAKPTTRGIMNSTIGVRLRSTILPLPRELALSFFGLLSPADCTRAGREPVVQRAFSPHASDAAGDRWYVAE
jgi:hypothetical protein